MVAATDPAAETVQPGPELAVVVPTFHERENVPLLVERLRTLLAGVAWEIIVVDDDSRDGTAAVARRLGERDRRIRCIRRIGRRGLAGACIEGMLATGARYVAVMDADLQHEETLLVPMLERIRRADVDLVVASRYLSADPAAGLDRSRERMSVMATRIAHLVTGVELTDPMSGFFMIRREVFETLAPALSSEGFKILFDIVATGGGRLAIVELPFEFRARERGESKLDTRIAIDYAALVASKLTGGAISSRFLLFCLVGLTGVGVHMVILQLAIAVAGLRFAIAQTIATVVAICWNFALNNRVTYRDQRLRGWQFAYGLVRFLIVCGIGAISNIGIASIIYGHNSGWWLAGLAGALLGAAWNYMASAAWVWRAR